MQVDKLTFTAVNCAQVTTETTVASRTVAEEFALIVSHVNGHWNTTRLSGYTGYCVRGETVNALLY